MNLKTPTWSLVLVILACFFSAVSTTKFRTKTEWLPESSSSSSSSSSHTYWSSGPMRNYAVKGSRYTSGSQGQPNVIYTKTYSMPGGSSETEWSSETVVTETRTSHNISYEEGGDMIIGTPIINQINGVYKYVQPTQYFHIIPSHVILSLQVADRFRYNAVFILGYLLQSPNSRLTLQQYTSLKIIYTALQRRQVQMYRLLPALIKLRGQSITVQLRTLMFELSKYLPQYYSCSATFWASQIQNNVFHADAIFITGHDEFDLFGGITESDIETIQKDKVDDEIGGYDEASKLTETLLGRVFVKIFKSITVNNLSLTQQLFAIIIRNLPNIEGDAVFEEYVQFIAEVAWRGGIPNWEEKQVYQDSIEIYKLIHTMTDRITSDKSVPEIIRYALTYIREHFVERENYATTATEIYRITGGGGLDITYLLSIISEGEFSYTSIDWKNQLLEFCRTHTLVIQTVLKGMNRYGYTSTKELLLAFLTRLRTRLSIEHIEIRKIVYRLLTTVEQKIQVWHVTHITPGHPTTKPNVTDRPTSKPGTVRPSTASGNGTKPNPHNHETTPSSTNLYTPTTPRHYTPKTPSSHGGHTLTTPGNVATPTKHPTAHPTDTTPGKSQPTERPKHTPTTSKSVTPETNLPTGQPTEKPKHTPTTSKSVTLGTNRPTGQPTEKPKHTPITSKSVTGATNRPTSQSTENPKHTPTTSKSVTGATNSPTSQSTERPKHTPTTSKSVTGATNRPTNAVTKYPPTKPRVIPKEVPELPSNINPSLSIPMKLTEYGVPIFTFDVSPDDTKDALTVPSVTCLQKSPNAKVPQKECETDTEYYIRTHLTEILGEDYIQEVLGSQWEDHYTTKISFLLELLENAQKNPKVTSKTELITIIKRYKIALKSVATYVFLPLIIEDLKLEGETIWSTFDYTNFSTSYIKSERPKQMGPNMITLPVVNPKYWLLPVDLNNPFANFLPDLPADSPDVVKLDSLYKIFRTNEIQTLLGKDWNPSVYPNRGALFISVLRTLLTRETIKQNTELYTLIQYYLKAVELPSVQTIISDTSMKNVVEQYYLVVIKPPLPSEISEIKAVIPETVNPETKIQVVISELGVPSIESLTTFDGKLPLENLVSLPSVTCLQRFPSAGNSPDNCDKDIDSHVTEILIQTFGTNYITVILGNNVEDHYPTRVSLLIALLEKVQTHPKIVKRLETVQIIRRYTIVLKSVASYVFLPLTVSYQTINDLVVWLSYDINNPSQTDIKSYPPVTVDDNNIITVPLINPKTWVLSVDVMEPFSGLVPKFSDSESSFAIQIQPLTKLIETGRIYKLLGPNWKALQFPNRGALYISVIYTLLTVKEVKIDTQLYALLQQYSIAIERSSTYVRISKNYFETVTHRWQIDQKQRINRFDSVVANVTARDDILLPALINPDKDLRVTVKTSSRIFVESSKGLETVPGDFIILPSVNCLQAFPDEDEDKYCKHFPDLPILHSLIKTLGTKGTQELLQQNWEGEYSTMAAFLENLCRKAVQNEKVAKEPTLVADIERYRLALEYASSYIFLPLLTNYQEIEAELIWLTYDTTDHRQTQMSLHRADNEAEENIVSLPLVNPKVWLQSVNIEYPFANFLPNLPANDPYAKKIEPLLYLLNSGDIRLLLGNNFTPANYPNRGALFLSALRVLLDSKTVQSNKQLHTLVENYFNVIQVVSLYVHITRSWINDGFTKATFAWNVDVADLSTALPFPTIKEERQYFYYMQHILRVENILQVLDIQLPLSSTYKAEFLILIIKRALASAEFLHVLSNEMQAALRYYSAKAELALVASGGVVKWVWVHRVEERTIKHTATYDIGKMFTITVPLSRLNSMEAKVHYFKLIKFMHDNPSFLKTDDFKYDHYRMFGHFMRAYLKHLMARPNIDKNVKSYIETVVEFIRNTGPGAMVIRPTKKKNH